MAVYEIAGEKYELPDDLTQDQLIESLTQLSEQQKGSGALGEVLGTGETAMTFATGALAEPISGLVGLGGLAAEGVSDTLQMLGLDKAAQFMNPGDLRELVEGVQSFMTYQPKTPESQNQLKAIGNILQPLAKGLEKASLKAGDVGYQLGGVTGGAVAGSIPEGIIEVIPGLKLPDVMSSRLAKKASYLKNKVSPEKTIDNTVNTIKTANLDEIVLDADIDPTFIKAADELGIDTSPIASFASKNNQFIEVEQALSAIRGSSLSAQSKEFISEVSDRASRLIDELGGEERGALSLRFTDEMTKTVDDLFNQADELYNSIDKQLDASAKVDAPETLSFITDQIKETGGKPGALLTKIKSDLETVVKSKTDVSGLTVDEIVKQPTYGLLSKVRKDVGQAIGKKTGPFKDGELGFLKALYSRLRKDQDKFATDSGFIDELKLADSLVIQRKGLEDSLISLLGKNIDKSLEPKVSQAVKGLAKGKTIEFDDIISNIPEKYRRPAIATALRDVISGRGATQADYSPNNFTKFMNNLSESGRNKLYSHLEPEGAKALDNLYRISKGINEALSQKRETGIVQATFDMFDKKRGFFTNLMGKPLEVTVKGMAAAKGGPMASSLVDQFLSQTSSRSRSAAELLGSRDFQRLITQSVRDGVHQGNMLSSDSLKLQKLVEKSDKYKKWAFDLSNSEKSRLASLGLVNFLIPETQEQE